VESQNFEIRKNVLKYDEVMNRQREVVYDWRRSILEGTIDQDFVQDWIEYAVSETVAEVIGDGDNRDWDWDDLQKELSKLYPTELGPESFDRQPTAAELADAAVEEALSLYEQREKEFGSDVLRQVEKAVLLSVIDNKWRDHLADMDYLRAGIGLRAMGQRDPLAEYQREAYDMFQGMVDAVKRDAVRYLFHVQPAQQADPVTATTTTSSGPPKAAVPASVPQRREPVTTEKIGRNDPCPCARGKKDKKCHGAVASAPPMAELTGPTAESLRERLAAARKFLDLEHKEVELQDLRAQAASPGLWDDPDTARQVTQKLANYEDLFERVNALEQAIEDAEV